MDKFVDDVFCELLNKKQWIDSKRLMQLRNDNRFVTLRENILLNQLISVAQYKEIALPLQTQQNRLLKDAPASLEYDEQFLQYGLQNQLIKPKDVEYCKTLLPVIRIRELLLLERKISFELYSQIMHTLAQDTVIQESFESSESTSPLHQYDSSDQTLIDAEVPEGLDQPTLPRELINSDNIVTKRQTTLSLVEDHASEMILNISDQDLPLAPNRAATTKPMTSSKLQPALTQDVPDDPEMTQNVPVPPPIPTEMQEDQIDASEDTLIDRPENIFSNQPAIHVNLRSREAIPEMPSLDEPMQNNPEAAESTADGNDSYQVEAAAETRTYPDASAKNTEGTTIQAQIFGGAGDQDANISQVLTSAVMGNLIKEVQNQVYLQTQQINQSVGKEISSYKSFYKILSAIVIFFSMFLLTFTGWIEVQRFTEMKDLRTQLTNSNQRNEELLAKNNTLEKQIPQTDQAIWKERMELLEQQKQFFEQQKQAFEQQKQGFDAYKQSIESQKQDLEKQLATKQQELTQKNNQQKLLESQMATLTQERDRLKQENQKIQSDYTHITQINNKINYAYQAISDMETYIALKEMSDNERATKLWDQIIKTSIPTVEKIGGDELAALRFFSLYKRPTDAVKTQAETSWLVAWKLGDYYEKQRDYANARIYFSKALAKAPHLKIIQTRLDRLPK